MVTTKTPRPRRQHRSAQLPGPGRSRIGTIVLASLAAGVVTAAVLVLAPFTPATEHATTAMLLLGLALGWALLAVLSVRLTDQPQCWAAAPATFLAVVAVTLLVSSPAVRDGLHWAWPPALLVLVVWMTVRIRRQLPARGARRLLYAVVAVLGIAAIGGGYETARESLDTKAYPPPGQLVDVGGHRLHLTCTGSGGPTVVLEPGLGGVSADLAWIAPVVAQDTRVCVYDRAGVGWSEPAHGRQDGARIAADLHTLLVRAQVPGPYVLAGHSFGGLYVQSFAAQFPNDVAGLVLLDSTAPSPDPAPSTPVLARSSDNAVGRVSALLPALAHVGVGRLLAQSSYDTLPVEVRAAARANASTARNLHSYLEELLEGSASTQEAAALTDLHGKPLLVLTADVGQSPGWQAKQDHMATLSTNSLHRVTHTSHAALVEDEEDSAAASQAVRDVVAAVRTSHPLAPR